MSLAGQPLLGRGGWQLTRITPDRERRFKPDRYVAMGHQRRTEGHDLVKEQIEDVIGRGSDPKAAIAPRIARRRLVERREHGLSRTDRCWIGADRHGGPLRRAGPTRRRFVCVSYRLRTG